MMRRGVSPFPCSRCPAAFSGLLSRKALRSPVTRANCIPATRAGEEGSWSTNTVRVAWRGRHPPHAVHGHLALPLPSHNENGRRGVGDSDAQRTLLQLI